jgi:hypothetical protein
MQPTLRTVEVVDIFPVGDPRHEQADRLPRPLDCQQVEWPRRDFPERVRPHAWHRPNLVGPILAQGFVIDLCDGDGRLPYLIDRPLVTLAEYRAEENLPALAGDDIGLGLEYAHAFAFSCAWSP